MSNQPQTVSLEGSVVPGNQTLERTQTEDGHRIRGGTWSPHLVVLLGHSACRGGGRRHRTPLGSDNASCPGTASISPRKPRSRLARADNEPIVSIWQRHRKIKEKESNIYDPNRPPSAGSTGRWIHNPQLPPLHSFTIAFRPKSLVKTSTVTLNLIYTDLRKAPNLNSHSTKSLITSCMS